MVQKESESLWSYIKRFTSTYTDVKNLNDSLVVEVFNAGLSNEHVQYALIHRDISTMQQLVAHAHKFAKVYEMRNHHLARAWQAESKK